MLARLANLEEKMRLARRLAGIAERPQQRKPLTRLGCDAIIASTFGASV
jgi:hypothetical protein